MGATPPSKFCLEEARHGRQMTGKLMIMKHEFVETEEVFAPPAFILHFCFCDQIYFHSFNHLFHLFDEGLTANNLSNPPPLSLSKLKRNQGRNAISYHLLFSTSCAYFYYYHLTNNGIHLSRNAGAWLNTRLSNQTVACHGERERVKKDIFHTNWLSEWATFHTSISFGKTTRRRPRCFPFLNVWVNPCRARFIGIMTHKSSRSCLAFSLASTVSCV